MREEEATRRGATGTEGFPGNGTKLLETQRMSPSRHAWLSRTTEEALEPDLPIVDAHHHLWTKPGDKYQLGQLRVETGGGHDVVQTVMVECGERYLTAGPVELRPVGETLWLAAEAVQSERSPGTVIAGIIPYIDLRFGPDSMRRALDAHAKAADGRLVGIRHATAWDASPAVFNHYTNPAPKLMRDETFRACVRILGSLGYTFDAFMYHPQVPDLVDLARQCPDTTVVLNHVGSPVGVGPYAGLRNEILTELARALADLASCQNAYIKLGGVGMPWFGDGWHKLERPPGSDDIASAWHAWFRTCIELFGPERCMFESNYPVDRRSASYVVIWNAYKKMTLDLAPWERAALFAGTARRVYGLPRITSIS